MKTLLIGMDGAQQATFQRGWTPFAQSLLEQGHSLDLWENLISRGWTEIITGQHGVVTGALYDRPDMDGSHSWSLRFKLDDIPGYGNQIKPLWQSLNEAGIRVGIMNVPTAFPAPRVDGFFVSGGGGGGPVLQDPLPELCHPKDILQDLLDLGYIVDERLGSLLAEKGLYEAGAFFGRLREKNEKRTKAFIYLAKKHEVDFGFVVYKSSSNIAEFLLLPELERLSKQGNTGTSALVDAVGEYYRAFDQELERLVKAFPGAEIILASDHGMAARRFLVNPNAFLVEEGFQTPSKINRGIYDLIKVLKKLVPFSLRTAIRSHSKVKHLYESMVSFDNQASKAFCMLIGDWSHGIYINDRLRFGGPVHPDQCTAIAQRIVERFNEHPVSREHGFSARLKPESDSPASPLYPDVELRLPNGYVTSNEEKGFVVPFEQPHAPLSIDSVTKGRLLCGKAHNPLATLVNGEWEISPSEDMNDLRLINAQILASYGISPL